MAFSPNNALDFLQNAHRRNRLAHAYLFTGPAGAGKRQLASNLSGFVNNLPSGTDPCKHPDVHIIEPESKSRVIKIEQMRELEREMQMRPSSATRKVGIVIDADRMNPSASNSFLKTLEEPPEHSLLLLLSENPSQLLDTILSRCVIIQLEAPARTAPSPSQLRLLTAIGEFIKNGSSGVCEVIGLAREFSVLLAEAKSSISGANEEALKLEQSHYKQTTDSAKWLEEREDYYKALSESRYLQQRFILVDTLLQWWADVLRHQQGGGQLDFDMCADATTTVATRFSTADVLKRLTHIEELRENFNRNVQETLAIEVAFLQAFFH